LRGKEPGRLDEKISLDWSKIKKEEISDEHRNPLCGV